MIRRDARPERNELHTQNNLPLLLLLRIRLPPPQVVRCTLLQQCMKECFWKSPHVCCCLIPFRPCSLVFQVVDARHETRRALYWATYCAHVKLDADSLHLPWIRHPFQEICWSGNYRASRLETPLIRYCAAGGSTTRLDAFQPKTTTCRYLALTVNNDEDLEMQDRQKDKLTYR